MKVLALGNSDSRGQYISGPTWTEVARTELERETGEPVSFDVVQYSLNAPTALAYAERKLGEIQPDVLVIPVGSYPFTAGFTWVRVRRLFGERAGRWYRGLEERFEKGTRGKGRLRNRVNRIARAVIPRVVGTQPMTTRQQLTESYGELFRALSRHEDLGVVLVTYPGRGTHAQSKKAIRERKIFFPEVEALARAHRFAWVDTEQVFAAVPASQSVHTHDGLHFNETGHRVLGSAIVAALGELQNPDQRTPQP